MKKSIHLEVEPQQLELLDEEKRKTGAPRNEVIRRAIESYLRRQDKKKGAGHVSKRNDARQPTE